MSEGLESTTPAVSRPSGAMSWWRGALAIVRRDAALWVGMAALYLLAAILLKRIPFLGNLVLVLLTPIPFASALLVARRARNGEAPGARAGGVGVALDRWLLRPLGALTRSLRGTDEVLRLIFACIVVLGLVMLLGIVEYLLTGGSLVSGFSGARYADAPLRPVALGAAAVVIALYVLVAMALLFLVHGVVFHSREPMAALAESFRLCRRHAWPLAIFVAPFLAVSALIAAAFGSSATHWLGYLLVFTLGVAALPLFVAGTLLAHQALAPGPAPSR
jgi:hypothetical protein